MGSNSHPPANTNRDDIRMATQQHDMIPEIPVTIDRHRPPVRNDDNAYRCASRCGRQCNCGCTCDRASNEVDMAEALTSQSSNIQQHHSRSVKNENDDEYVHCPEGAETHLIEVGDFGQIPEKEILRALARQGRLPHTHHGILPSPFTTPAASSMVVEADDGSDETASSVYSHLSQRSGGSSSLLSYTGHWLDQIGMTTFTSGLGTVYNPLALTPDYPLHIEISERDLRDLPSFDLGFL